MREDISNKFDNKLTTWAAVLLATVILAAHSIMIHPWILDDALISFRYAENFVSGNGLVFNPGERVEGYTTFLWVILLSVGKLLGMNLVTFSKVAGYGFSIGTILLTAFSFRFSPAISRVEAAIATTLLGSCGVFTAWAGSGMEVAMFTFSILLTALVYLSALERGPEQGSIVVVGLLAGCAALIRPEGVLIFAILLLHLVVTSKENRWKNVTSFCAAFALVYGIYFIWRFNYYGYLLPNTFYAKVGSGMEQALRGLKYSAGFGLTASLMLIPVVIAVVLRKLNRKLVPLLIAPILVIAYSAYIVVVGGDVMPAYRFYSPMVPLICLMSAVAITSLLSSRKLILITLTVLAIVIYNIAQLRFNDAIYTHIKSDNVALDGELVGLWLRQNAPPKSIVATNSAGSIPYYSKLVAIDMLGMNDAHIAHREVADMGAGIPGHEKGDGAYVLSRNPDYIILGSSLGSETPYSIFLSDLEIYRDRGFHSNYELKTHRFESGKTLVYYQRKFSINRQPY